MGTHHAQYNITNMTDKCFNKYYKSTEHFRICNNNPMWESKRGFKWDRTDCAVRALANSTSCSWVDAFDYLTSKARRDYAMPNDMTRYRMWMVESGATWTACKAVKGKKRMTCLDFAQEHSDGRYIIQIANHLCACVDGVILDAWNTAAKAVVGYFDMSSFDYIL